MSDNEQWARVDLEAAYNHDGAVEYKIPGGGLTGIGKYPWVSAERIMALFPNPGRSVVRTEIRQTLSDETVTAWLEYPL